MLHLFVIHCTYFQVIDIFHQCEWQEFHKLTFKNIAGGRMNPTWRGERGVNRWRSLWSHSPTWLEIKFLHWVRLQAAPVRKMWQHLTWYAVQISKFYENVTIGGLYLDDRQKKSETTRRTITWLHTNRCYTWKPTQHYNRHCCCNAHQVGFHDWVFCLICFFCQNSRATVVWWIPRVSCRNRTNAYFTEQNATQLLHAMECLLKLHSYFPTLPARRSGTYKRVYIQAVRLPPFVETILAASRTQHRQQSVDIKIFKY